MSDRSRISSDVSRSADKLGELSHKLKSILDRGKDVTREKYMDLYERCTSMRKDVESAAIEALDNGNSKQFDYLAGIMHNASVIIEEYEKRLNIPKEMNDDKTRKITESIRGDLDNWATFDDDNNNNISSIYSDKQSIDVNNNNRRSYSYSNYQLDNYDESLLLYYIQLLEKCLEYNGYNNLFKRLIESPINIRIDILKDYLNINNNDGLSSINDINIIQQDISSIKLNELDNTLPRINIYNSDDIYKLNIPEGYLVEPLWREINDGGLSNYMGKYLLKGGDLFECMKYIIKLHVNQFVNENGITNVKISLIPKVQGLDVSIILKGFIIYDFNNIISSYNLKRDDEMILDGKINLKEIPHDEWPGLELIIIESDGSKSNLSLDLPIGLFSHLLPVKLDYEHFNHLWNSIEYTSSKQVRIYSSKIPLMIHDLIPICSKIFSINVYNDILLMSASTSDTVLGILYIEDSNLIVLQLRTLCRILQHSIFLALKEMFSTLNNDKIIAKSNLLFNKLPFSFDKPFSRITHRHNNPDPNSNNTRHVDIHTISNHNFNSGI